MGIINADNAVGHIVTMQRTHEGHMDSNGKKGLPAGEGREGFGNMVAGALDGVSAKQNGANALFERMITHPDEVEPHDVTIAMAQAEMSLNLTKAIVDRAVKAYNDITAMR